MWVLVKILRALTGAFALCYLVFGMGISFTLINGTGPGGWGPWWFFAAPVVFWIGTGVVYLLCDEHLRASLVIVIVTPPLAFFAGAVFGVAPEFWESVLAPLGRRWTKAA